MSGCPIPEPRNKARIQRYLMAPRSTLANEQTPPTVDRGLTARLSHAGPATYPASTSTPPSQRSRHAWHGQTL